jgi:protoporphyrinogen oxidase
MELDDAALLGHRASASWTQLLGIDAPNRSSTASTAGSRSNPQYDVGHLERDRRHRARRCRRASTSAGSPYRGVGIPDCVKSGAGDGGADQSPILIY